MIRTTGGERERERENKIMPPLVHACIVACSALLHKLCKAPEKYNKRNQYQRLTLHSRGVMEAITIAHARVGHASDLQVIGAQDSSFYL